jgi:kynurenine formamidase
MAKVAWTGVLMCLVWGCTQSKHEEVAALPQPSEMIDLGVLITEDLPERMWGKGFMEQMNFHDSNTFDVRHWEFGALSGSNAYYNLFNHGGPHVDAPNHTGMGQGLDSYPIESFVGPVKVFDVSDLKPGRNVTRAMLQDKQIIPGDIVLIYTGYQPPGNESDVPESITLNYEASEFLANIPIRAFGTDAFSVDSLTDQRPVDAESEEARTVPVHHSFLTRNIPAYEQLMNVDKLLGRSNLLFIGVPLNIADGDGMLVRPVVIVY